MDEDKPADMVYKSREFIEAKYVRGKPLRNADNQLVEAQYGLSAPAQKLTAVLISKVNPLGDTLPSFKLSMSEFSDLMGIRRQSAHEMVDNLTTELMQVFLDIRRPDSIKSFDKLTLFTRSRYDHDEKIVEFEFEPRLDHHLRDFSGNFTKYHVDQIKKLTSKYAIRLYEILRQAHPMNCSKAITCTSIELDELKAMLGILADKKSYLRYSDFRRMVIVKAREQIRENTDLDFTFTGNRKGRKVSSITFHVRHNDQLKLAEETISGEVISSVNQEQFNQLTTAVPALSEKEAGYLVANFDKEQIAPAVMAYMQAVMSGVKIEKPAAYFLAILRNQIREDNHWKSKQPTNFTTEEMLDTSWADDFQFQFEDDA